MDVANYIYLKNAKQLILEKNIKLYGLVESKYEDEDFGIKIEAMKKELNESYPHLVPVCLRYNNVLVDEFNLRWYNINIEGAL